MLWGLSPRENDMKLKVGIVDDWRSFWKMHSLYVFVFIGAIPDLWNLLIASGLLHELPIGERLDSLVKWAALAGAAVRLLKVRLNQQLAAQASGTAE